MAAYEELAFQKTEKGKRAAELIIATKELIFQNQEKEKRATELAFANTELEKSKEKLLRSEFQVRKFAQHLHRVQEEEKAHLAREIHDEFGQRLAGLKIELFMLKENKNRTVSETVDKINILMKNIDILMHSLRKIATELRPGILDTLGLVPSIEWLVQEFEKRTGIICKIEITALEDKFDSDISICFFRICQEALTNICKHSEAKNVKVRIFHNHNELSLEISDDGKGIASEKLENPFSMGLLGMRERANLIGATLSITSKINVGTTIQLMDKNINELQGVVTCLKRYAA
jgi:signal transduction histidine kinase